MMAGSCDACLDFPYLSSFCSLLWLSAPLTILVGNCARRFTGRLAGSLAFAAAPLACCFPKVCFIYCLYMFHNNTPFMKIQNHPNDDTRIL
jgi:hypothetical protein